MDKSICKMDAISLDTDLGTQIWGHRFGDTELEAQNWGHRIGGTELAQSKDPKRIGNRPTVPTVPTVLRGSPIDGPVVGEGELGSTTYSLRPRFAGGPVEIWPAVDGGATA